MLRTSDTATFTTEHDDETMSLRDMLDVCESDSERSEIRSMRVGETRFVGSSRVTRVS
jgi:hypothetical protein